MSRFTARRTYEVTPLVPVIPNGSIDTGVTPNPYANASRSNGHIIVNGGFHGTPPATPPAHLTDGDAFDSSNPESPGFHRTHSYDAVLFDIRKIHPEKIAAQLTLIDLPLFQAIRMDELANCNWAKKDKKQLAPNVVAFTQKFNHTTFWVVREILNESSPRRRAEVLSQFIKIAKKLLELNNLHSLKAVVAGLQSAPIYRLTQTWKVVPKKDKQTFERLEDFLSDDNNWKSLRSHMNAAKLPCIPHLGVYQTDLTYLSTVSNRGGGATVAQEIAAQIETIINMIAYCQNSSYDDLSPEPPIQKYLTHHRYIDELQKFFEDENYKLSLKHEPKEEVTKRTGKLASGARSGAGSQLRSSKSHEDLLTPFTSGSMDSLSQSSSSYQSDSRGWSTPQPPSKRTLSSRHTHLNLLVTKPLSSRGSTSSNALCNGDSDANRVRVTVEKSPSFSGSSSAPKRSTLPTNFRESSSSSSSSPSSSALALLSGFAGRRRKSMSEHSGLPGLTSPSSVTSATSVPDHSLHRLHGSARERKGSSPVLPWRRHKKSQSLGTNVLTVLGSTKSIPRSAGGSPDLPRNLLDDSVMDETFTSFGTNTPTGSIGNVSSSSTSESDEGGGAEEEGEKLFKRLDDFDELSVDQLEVATSLKEGTLKRKVLKRNGRSLSLRRRTKCYAQLTPTSLLLYTSKPRQRKSSKPQTVKGILLKECRIKYKNPMEKMNEKEFVIIDDKGNHTKFAAKCSLLAKDWVEAIREAMAEEEERERRDVERSLIKF